MSQEIISLNNVNRDSIRNKLPKEPGTYLFKDDKKKVIYVGKAKNLRNRVLSYFRPKSELTYKTALMMNRAKALDYILTKTEKEAFILENSLIKKHNPRYNIVLRDGSQYPSLRLGLKEDYPTLRIVRKIKKDGAIYFGPFSSAQSVRSTLQLINRIFPLRKCKTRDLPRRSRPCLNFQLGRCLGPCSNDTPKSSYMEVVQQVRMFLEGRSHELVKDLRQRMLKASKELNFEQAARLRDQIKAVEKVIERQHVVSTKLQDQDAIGLAREGGHFMIVVLHVRKGYLSGSRNFFVNRNIVIKGSEEESSEVMDAFLKQYYSDAAGESFIPKYVLLSEDINDPEAITEWLSDMAGKKVLVNRPKRGERRRLVEMAMSNAENLLKRRSEPDYQDLLKEAGASLQLKRTPWHIEGLDISNLQGEMAVGALVCFRDGVPDKSGYRNYKIRDIKGVDDYGMMMEMVTRRLSKGEPPDLFLVDGGKGHLSAVKTVVDRFEGEDFPDIVAIAKGKKEGESDRLFIPNRKNPVKLNRDNRVLHLMMRIRDETHRRAITYHRRLRSGTIKNSTLDSIEGIGPKRKKALLMQFGSVSAISKAGYEELLLTPGITESTAVNIVEYFKKN